MTDDRQATDTETRSAPTRLCLVAPCYNEEEVLPLFYQALKPVLDSIAGLDYRILFVDDGSTDRTLEVLDGLAAADERVMVYSFSRNFGHQVALTAGLDMADGDAVLFMDSDLQHPPELIPRMVELWRQGNQVVSATRQQTAGASLMKRATSNGFYWLINRLSDRPVVWGAADFCLLDRLAYEALRQMPERHRFLRGMVSWIGFRRVCLPFSAPSRAAGRSKYTMLRMIRLAMDAVFSFSATPIRMVGRLGMVIVALGVLYLLYIVGRYLIIGDLVPGWASLVVVVTILGGLQLLALGISGEYLARIFEESKHRPLYFFRRPSAKASWPIRKD
jgi:polyisoprenyl-phosphate glycosyltransferase